MLLSAGMHGEETNGIEIVRKVMLHDEVSKLNCGTLIAIPVINVISFLYGSFKVGIREQIGNLTYVYRFKDLSLFILS